MFHFLGKTDVMGVGYYFCISYHCAPVIKKVNQLYNRDQIYSLRSSTFLSSTSIGSIAVVNITVSSRSGECDYWKCLHLVLCYAAPPSVVHKPSLETIALIYERSETLTQYASLEYEWSHHCLR